MDPLFSVTDEMHQSTDQMPLFSNVPAASTAPMSRFGFSSENVAGRVQECRLELMMTSRLPLNTSRAAFSDSTRPGETLLRYSAHRHLQALPQSHCGASFFW